MTYTRQNSRILAPNQKSIAPSVRTIKRTASVMVWGAITSDGRTPLVFIDQGVKINGGLCRKYFGEYIEVFGWLVLLVKEQCTEIHIT